MNLAILPNVNNLRTNQSSNNFAHQFIYCFKTYKPINLDLFEDHNLLYNPRVSVDSIPKYYI